MTREQRAKKRVRELEAQLDAAKTALAEVQRDRVLKSAGVAVGDTVWVNVGDGRRQPYVGEVAGVSLPMHPWRRTTEVRVRIGDAWDVGRRPHEIFKTYADALAACKVMP